MTPDETAEERERRIVAEAEKRAREATRIEAHLATHDRQFERVSSTADQTVGELRALARQVGELAGDFRKSLTVSETRAQDAEKAVAKQVTSRELYMTAIGVTAAIISALAAGGVFG